MKTHESTHALEQSKFLLWLSGIVLALASLVGASVQEAHAELLVSNTVSVLRYDETTGAFLGVLVPSGSGGVDSARGLAIGPDGNLYVASFGSQNILRYDGVTGAFIDVFVIPGSGGLGQPSDVAFGPDGNLYVADALNGTNSILRYNGNTGAFIDIFATGGGIEQALQIVFSPDGNLFVSNSNSTAVLRYHGDTGLPHPAAGQSGAIFIPGIRPFNTIIAFDTHGVLYARIRAAQDIQRYDGATGAFLDTFIPNGATGKARFGPDGNLYVLNSLGHSVSRYNGTTGAFIDALVVPGSGGLEAPIALVFKPSLANDVVMEAETMFLSGGYSVEPGERQIFIADTVNNPTGYAHLSFPGGPGTYQIEVQLVNGGTGISVVEFYLNGERLGYQYFDFSTENLKLVLPTVTMLGGDDIILAGNADGDGGARVDKIVFVPQ
jgi:streptogramin lyase